MEVKNFMLGVLTELKKRARSVVVGVSCGKDSVTTLDLLASSMDRVEAFFMYLVPGLSFQGKYLAYLERRYEMKIHRLPHWQLGMMLATGSYRRMRAPDIRRLTVTDVENVMRDVTGIDWIAGGHRADESLSRRRMIQSVRGIDEKNRRVFPIAFWKSSTVYNYLKRKKILFPPDYAINGASFGSLNAKHLRAIKTRFPSDYRKILEVFPYAEAIIKREEFRKNNVGDGPENGFPGNVRDQKAEVPG